jgi:adiponectin receptor
LYRTLTIHTVNIHSHTIGCLLFAWLPFHFYANVYNKIENPQPAEALLFVLYFIGVALCFACSAWFVVRMTESIEMKTDKTVRSCHVTWNLSPSAASFGNRLDFCGIVLLMWGASLPSIHFAFACDPTLKIIHWCFVWLSTTSMVACKAHQLQFMLTKSRYRQVQVDAYCSPSIRRFWDPRFANIERWCTRASASRRFCSSRTVSSFTALRYRKGV